jgi:uncharacterized protein (DUF2141 family)
MPFGKATVRGVLLLAACAARTAQAADLDIEVRGVKLPIGQVHVAVFENSEDFSFDPAFRAMIMRPGAVRTSIAAGQENRPHPPVETASAPANARIIRLQILDVPPGNYALAVYHDVNDNGKLDTDSSGMPLEPWGMSNNPHNARAGKPTFDDARFLLPAKGARLIVHLH